MSAPSSSSRVAKAWRQVGKTHCHRHSRGVVRYLRPAREGVRERSWESIFLFWENRFRWGTPGFLGEPRRIKRLPMLDQTVQILHAIRGGPRKGIHANGLASRVGAIVVRTPIPEPAALPPPGSGRIVLWVRPGRGPRQGQPRMGCASQNDRTRRGRVARARHRRRHGDESAIHTAMGILGFAAPPRLTAALDRRSAGASILGQALGRQTGPRIPRPGDESDRARARRAWPRRGSP